MRGHLKTRHWHGAGEGKCSFCCLIMILCPGSEVKWLMLCEGEHIYQSCFLVGCSTSKLGQLAGVVAEISKPCVTQT